MRTKEEATAYMREWRKRNPEKAKAAKLRQKLKDPEKHSRMSRGVMYKFRYGITLDDYEKMLSDQGGVCKICKGSDTIRGKHFSVDHCHETGKVRGLLCINCNLLIGYAQNNVEILKKAIEYLSI